MNFVSEAKLLKALDDHGKGYREAFPFPHAVIDGLFDNSELRKALAAPYIPAGSLSWDFYNNENEGRKMAAKHPKPYPFVDLLLREFDEPLFLTFLENLTGITGLIPDPYRIGGGVHLVGSGGYLKVHVDFNRHPKMNLDRRLNVLLYLNDGWDETWGGALGLYQAKAVQGGKHPWEPVFPATVKITPLLGRLVVFNTSPWSFHGHPEPLKCPEDRNRMALALYYYTNGRPVMEQMPEHSTIFKLE